MSNKIFKIIVLLVVLACIADACKQKKQTCQRHSECCSGRCQKLKFSKNRICIGSFSIGGSIKVKRYVSDNDGVQDIIGEAEYFDDNDEDNFFEEHIDDIHEYTNEFTTSIPSAKHCSFGGTPCDPNGNTCCSRRCLLRRGGIHFCARGGRSRTSTSKPTLP